AAVLVIAPLALFLRNPVWDFFKRPSAPVEEAQDSLNGSASELTQRARELLKRYDKSGYIDRAIRLSEAALQKDSNFAPAYAALAQAHLRQGIGSSDKLWLNQATDAAKKAVTANPDLAAAHEVLGAALVESGDSAGAKAELDQTLRLDPLNSPAYI